MKKCYDKSFLKILLKKATDFSFYIYNYTSLLMYFSLILDLVILINQYF